MVHLGSVQINEFDRVSEIHPKINSKHNIMYGTFKNNISTVRIEQNQHWPGNKHPFLTLLLAQTKMQCSFSFGCTQIFKRLFLLHAHAIFFQDFATIVYRLVS